MTKKAATPKKPDAFDISLALETSAATLRQDNHPASSSAPRAVKASRAASGRTSRRNTHQIAGHFPVATYKAMRLLSADTGKPLQALLGEALHDLLTKYGQTKLLRA